MKYFEQNNYPQAMVCYKTKKKMITLNVVLVSILGLFTVIEQFKNRERRVEYDEEVVKLAKIVYNYGKFNSKESLERYVTETINSKEIVIMCVEDEELPDCFDKLKMLEKLTILCTNTKRLPDSFKYLGNLKELTIRYTNLSDVDNNLCLIRELKKLEKLDLSNNKLKKIPKEVFGFNELRNLSIKGNEITDIELIPTLTKLEILDLSCCNISSIPEDIGKLDKLIKLNIRENKIGNNYGSLVNLSQLRSLESLNVTSNKITEFPSEIISGCKKLKNFEIKSNPFSNAEAVWNMIEEYKKSNRKLKIHHSVNKPKNKSKEESVSVVERRQEI